MAMVDLKIGVWSEKTAWSNKILWLFQDEVGYPSELITEDVHAYPVVVVSYEKFIENLSTVSDYIRQGGSLLIVCTQNLKEPAKQNFPKDVFPVNFGDACPQIGHCVVLENENPLLAFFPQRQLLPEKRKDFNLNVVIREVQVFPPAKTIVELETAHGDRHPLLVCGETEEGGRFAIITAEDDMLPCQHHNWGAIIYLSALEWCLMNKPFIRKWHWPNGKRMVVTLTFDFETLSKYSNMRKYWWWHRNFDRFLLGLGLRPILNFLMDKKLRSTWFMLGSQAIRNPDLVKKLVSNELIEIAGHGDVHMDIDKSAKRFDQDDLSVQKDRLKAMRLMIGSVTPLLVEGFRAPGLYANHDTLMALQESGFRWDCSASPQTDYSTRWFFLPYHPIIDWENKRELNVVEIPVVEPWDQWCPAHGSPHSAQEYLQEILENFKFLYFIGGLQTLLIHPYWITVHRAWWKAVESFIVRILQFSDVAILSCSEVYSCWALRRKMIMEAAYNVDTSTIHVQIRNAEPGLSLLVRIPEGYQAVDVVHDDATSVPFRFWKDLHSIIFVVDVQGYCRYTILLSKQ